MARVDGTEPAHDQGAHDRALGGVDGDAVAALGPEILSLRDEGHAGRS